MAIRDLTVRIRAEIGSFNRDMALAANSARKASKEIRDAGNSGQSGLGKLAATAKANEKAWNQTSNGMLAAGTAITAGLGMAAKAAMDWESAWTGVLKTVDGSDQQLAAVEGGLRNLAKTLPSTHTEIAQVAESAGQLGVKTKDIVGFTKTMIDLGESTNLTADEAATNIAQISNVMGTMEREGSAGIRRFGSTLVALGNDGASTEKDILSMAQRIAGAGATVGATEADVLALSNTLASMGVRAELGGGVATRVILKMRTAVDEGGESLEAFASTAGMSADDFAAKFKGAPMEALDAVAQGINRVNKEGGNVVATLKDMGIKGTEETQVMLALANAGSLLKDSLALGAAEWDRNMALTEEAGKRYETTESQVKIAWNGIKDAAIDAGATILPAIQSIAEGATGLMEAWLGIPEPVRSTMTVLGGFAGVGLLVAGGLMKMVPAIFDTVAGMRNLKKEAPGAYNGITKIGKAAGIAALAVAGLQILGTILSREHGASAQEIAQGILKINDATLAGKDSLSGMDDVFSKWDTIAGSDRSGGIKEVASAIEEVANPSFLEGVNKNFNGLNKFFGLPDDKITLLEKRFADLGLELGNMASNGNIEESANAFRVLSEEFENNGRSAQDALNFMPGYADALREIATQAGATVTDQELLQWALSGVAPAAVNAAAGLESTSNGLSDVTADAKKAADAVNEYFESLVNAGLVVLGERESLRQLEEAFTAASEAAKENGKNLDITTEKGRANQAALDGIASAALSTIEAQRKNGASSSELADTMERSRSAFIANAIAMGMGKKEAAALADSLNLIPGAVYISYDSNADDLAGKLKEINELVQNAPDGHVTINENSPEVIKSLKDLGFTVETLPDGKIKVTDNGTASATGKEIDAVAAKHRTATINTNAATAEAERQLNWVARPRSSSISIKKSITESITQINNGPVTSQFGRANGGRIPFRATGGRLPYTGLGRDKILGISTKDGTPTSWVDDGEWVIRERQSSKFDTALQMINNDDPAIQHLAGLAKGGRVGDAEKRIDSLQKQIRRIPGTKANRGRKADLQDQLADARKELKDAKAEAVATKKQTEAAKKAAKEERERQGRFNELRSDKRRDIRRGSVVDSFTSGSGLSVVDELIGLSRNDTLSKGQRRNASRSAASLESQLRVLDKQSDSLKTKLEKATEARDRLLEVSKSVSQGLRGEFSLGGVLSNLLSGDQKGPLDAESFVKAAQGKASQIRRFGGLLNRLRKQGYSEAIVREIADLGTVEGTQVGNALLGASSTERKQLNQAYESMDYWSGRAGKEVTLSMERGGIDAAEGLVRGLEKKNSSVESAFYKLGKNAEKAFRRSLDMHSPSRTLFKAGEDAADGAILGGESKEGLVEKTFSNLGKAAERGFDPRLASTRTSGGAPSTRESSMSARISEGPTYHEIVSALGEVISGWKPMVVMDGRKFYGVMQKVKNSFEDR